MTWWQTKLKHWRYAIVGREVDEIKESFREATSNSERTFALLSQQIAAIEAEIHKAKILARDTARSSARRPELLSTHIGPQQSARSYYPLNDGWALTSLSTGQMFFVDTQERNMTPWIITLGRWETFVDDIIAAYIRPGMKIIDVGANMGYYSVKWGSQIGPTGELHAFEPNPYVLEFLRENIAINALSSRCHVHGIAAGSSRHTGTLRLKASAAGGARLGTSEDDGDQSHEVTIDAIDNVLPALNYIDLFKVDAEGYEPEVLRGARDLIARSPHCAFHLEATTAWERFGRIPDILRPILQGRRMFIMQHDKTLMPITIENIATYLHNAPHLLADIFICPEEAQLLGRIEGFIARESQTP